MSSGISVHKQPAIEIMKRAGHILTLALEATCAAAQPGVTELELDAIAEYVITSHGGYPGFKKVPGYHHTICAIPNSAVVHGIPKNRPLEVGDIIGIDCGVYLEGYHSDMAETVRIRAKGEGLRVKEGDFLTTNYEQRTTNDDEDPIDRFLRIGKESMWDGIHQVKPGNRVGHISRAMQEKIEGIGGYSVVRSLVGHGIGHELHEDPEIPGYLARPIEKTALLVPGMALAIESIYAMGGPEVEYEGSDEWTIVTRDGSLAGMFERTVVVTETGFEVLTK